MMCLFIILYGNVFGQNPPFINYNEQNQLSTNVVYGLFQDSEDNIWFCTNSGAVKFNGSKLVTYEKKDGLTSNEVFKIFEDSRHRLWFMTASGRVSYYRNKRIYNEKDHPVLGKVQPGSFISDIYEDEKRNIWVVSDRGLIYKFSEDLGKMESFTANLHNGHFFMHRGAVYLAFREGIYSVESRTLIIRYPGENRGLIISRHCRLPQMIYTGRDQQIISYDFRNQTIHSHEIPELPIVLNALVMIDSALYICSSKGVSIFDTLNLRQTGQFFQTENVSHVLKDREGSLWVSTLNSGVIYIPNNRINFLRSADFFQGNKILKLNGLGRKVIIGQSNSKASYYNNGKIVPINSPNESKGEGLTYVIKPNPADSSFIISNQSGVTQFSLSGKLRFFKNITMLGYAEVDKDSVYISTPSIIGKFPRELTELNFSYLNNPLAFDSIRAGALYYDRKEDIVYACSRMGLIRYRGRTKLPDRYPALTGLSLTDIDKTSTGILIITTFGDGVFFIHGDRVVNINDTLGLTNNMCSSVFVQNDSTVWVTSYNGLNRIICYPETGGINIRVMNFYRNDGLPSNYINDIYVYRDSVWLATNMGLALFNENDLTRYSYTPRISIEAIKVNNAYLPLSFDHPIKLERNSSSIVIEFNSTTFKNAGSVGYKYKLSGMKSDWMETRNNQVDFTGLEPGNYSFEVYAYSLNGKWRTEVAHISFVISPAFWETLWFRVLAIIVFLFLAVWAIVYQFRKVKNQFDIRQKMMNYEKELLELEQQALRLQMNPHFIFNALNSIQHSILSGKQDQAYHHLELFPRSSGDTRKFKTQVHNAGR
ncbi:MAG: histidine kinase [Chitinophagaceae bacterium]|nr:histidine kinase [Chitinophagaceae bacterium]